MQFADDEFQFGRIANVLYFLGRLEGGPVDQRNLIQMGVMAKLCQEDLEKFGFRVSARGMGDIIDILEGKHPSPNLESYCMILRTNLMTELESTLFLHVEYSVARYYREPRRGWEEVVTRFPDAISDIEEASKCYALSRYAASIFHSTQVIEIGLIEIGKFISIPDPRSGFTAVCSELKRILEKKYDTLSDFEKANRPFFEQVYATSEALKNAWRNKISHAQQRLVLLSADFTPAIAEEILVASRAFMRRLAEDMPS